MAPLAFSSSPGSIPTSLHTFLSLKLISWQFWFGYCASGFKLSAQDRIQWNTLVTVSKSAFGFTLFLKKAVLLPGSAGCRGQEGIRNIWGLGCGAMAECLPGVHNTEFTPQHIQNEVGYFTLVSLLKKKKNPRMKYELKIAGIWVYWVMK